MEVVWVPLNGQAGTGPALDAAVEVAMVSAPSPGGGGTGGVPGVQSPLRRERDGHRRAATAAAAAGLPPPSFETWVLWEDDGSDPAVSSPNGSGHGHSRRSIMYCGVAGESRLMSPTSSDAAMSTSAGEGEQRWLT